MSKFSEWILKQDVAIQFVHETLTSEKVDHEKQARIATEGYGHYLLSQQNENGHWGKYYYQPKWTSTHYTLLQLKELGISPEHPACRQMVQRMFDECQLEDGGLNLAKSEMASDICVDGMILNYASYFIPESEKLILLVQSILQKQKTDGGFTWFDQSQGDPHSTICVLEGLVSFQKCTEFKNLEINQAIQRGLDYFYQHDLFLADKNYQKLAYPFRYFYSTFRFLLLAANIDLAEKEVVTPALKLLQKKEQEGFFKLEKTYKGQTFLNFSQIKESNPFLTVYGRYILDYFKS